MNYGMLWFDNDPKTSLTDKIIRAGNYYFKKYGMFPNACIVNPVNYDKDAKWDGMKIEKSATIIPNHLWLGVK